jgi:hypothetical protein
VQVRLEKGEFGKREWELGHGRLYLWSPDVAKDSRIDSSRDDVFKVTESNVGPGTNPIVRLGLIRVEDERIALSCRRSYCDQCGYAER